MNERLDRLALRYANIVVGVSQAQSEKIKDAGVPRAKIVTIRNAIDRSRFAGRDPAGRAALAGLVAAPVKHIVGFAGRLSPEKGPDIFVRAAIATLRHRSDVGFVLFGDGPMKAEVFSLIRQAGASDHISPAGFQPNLDRLMPNLDILALTSYTEGLPNAILEAMAAGVPVVATSVGGVPEAISDGKNGLLVAPGDPTAVFEGVHKLLSDASFRSTLVAAGLRRVEQEFTFEAQALRYESLIRELAAST
jgi:glycosyltransferase involved in cell wall biosynthesis